ncbi:hypothetical protein FB451DRAFT_1169100 [Mycena latifolia]|nr:hypothetical protein FB451DRAFT_1169100 [Mycena latifolia]
MAFTGASSVRTGVTARNLLRASTVRRRARARSSLGKSEFIKRTEEQIKVEHQNQCPSLQEPTVSGPFCPHYNSSSPHIPKRAPVVALGSAFNATDPPRSAVIADVLRGSPGTCIRSMPTLPYSVGLYIQNLFCISHSITLTYISTTISSTMFYKLLIFALCAVNLAAASARIGRATLEDVPPGIEADAYYMISCGGLSGIMLSAYGHKTILAGEPTGDPTRDDWHVVSAGGDEYRVALLFISSGQAWVGEIFSITPTADGAFIACGRFIPGLVKVPNKDRVWTVDEAACALRIGDSEIVLAISNHKSAHKPPQVRVLRSAKTLKK